MNKRLKYAPVFISVYNRMEHFKKCLISLSKCHGSDETIVYISSDGAYRDEDVPRVKEIRKFILDFKGFKKIIPIFVEENTKGQIKSEVNKIILENHNRWIRSEDDNIFAPDFLTFLNDGLDRYEFDEKIFSISGFSHSLFYDIPDFLTQETYFTQRFNPWGVGRWREKNMLVPKYDISDIKNDLMDKSFQLRLNELGIDLLPSWFHEINAGQELSGDYRYVYYMLKKNLYTVSPYSTKVFNTGNDGSGTRTRISKRFSSFNIKNIDNEVPYKLKPFSKDYVDNSFNYRFNYTPKNVYKNVLLRYGLLEFGYKLNKLLL